MCYKWRSKYKRGSETSRTQPNSITGVCSSPIGSHLIETSGWPAGVSCTQVRGHMYLLMVLLAALVTEPWTFGDDGLIGKPAPLCRPPQLTSLPVVFVVVTVKSWVPPLMRTSSPWMRELVGHLCTPARIPLFVGGNRQIPSFLP